MSFDAMGRPARLEAAPAAHERGEHVHGLLDARHRAPFVRLVREPGLAGAQDHRGRAAVAGLEPRAVRGEGDRLRRRALLQEGGAHLENLLHPLGLGLGVERRRVHDGPHLRPARAQERLQRVAQVPVVDPRHGAHVDGDRRGIGHGVGVEAAADGAHVQGGAAHHGMGFHGKVEVLEVADHARHPVDGVVAHLGHRAVRGDARRLDLEPDQALVAHVGVVGGGLGHDDGAGPVQQLRVREEAGPLAADLLARGDDQDDAGAPGEPRRQLDRRRHEGRDAALHVGGAAAVEPVAVGLARERVLRPRLGAQRDGVDVAGEADRGPVRVAADLRDEARAALRELVVGRAESRGLEDRAQVAGAGALHARRVDRVEGEQLPGEPPGIDAGLHPRFRWPQAPLSRRRRARTQWLSVSTATEKASAK